MVADEFPLFQAGSFTNSIIFRNFGIIRAELRLRLNVITAFAGYLRTSFDGFVICIFEENGNLLQLRRRRYLREFVKAFRHMVRRRSLIGSGRNCLRCS